MTTNLQKLRLVMALFRVRPIDLCRIGYSKTYISRLFSGDLQPSQEFFIKLNGSLMDIIAHSGGAASVFDVSPVQLDGMQTVVEETLKSA